MKNEKNREEKKPGKIISGETFYGPVYDMALLAEAQECWNAGAEYRAERERCKRFTYGEQWGDYVMDGEQRITEYEQIRRQGNLPLKNNLIRRLVRNVLGVYRNRWKYPECTEREIAGSVDAESIRRQLRYNMELNRMEELYARTMEEFLIGGLVVHKKWFGRRGTRTDCWTDLVQPTNFFVDRNSRDFRCCDISMIGEIHEMDFETLVASFATGPEMRDRLRGAYGALGHRERCRVYEIWTLEHPTYYLCHDRRSGVIYRVSEEEYNTVRGLKGNSDIETEWRTAEEWHYHFLTPDGEVLRRGVSPYAHGGHPYVYKAYPYIDGEIHSFVSDIIDQQKFTNRLISMYDWILRASAKGVLLFPEGSLPDGINIEDVAEEWGRFNGVIVYKPRPGVPLPQQVSSNAADIGIIELLNIQMKMMEDISGVNGALQGKLDSTSMSGTLYNQQTQNSLTALADLLRSFDDFVSEATTMDVANIRQFVSGV